MRFTLDHARAGVGSNLTISVEAEGDEIIASVTTTYDGFPLRPGDIEAGSRGYQCGYRQQGDGGPGTEHKLVVRATTTEGKLQSATSSWVDDV
jgi:hypothetical protein